MPNLDPAEVAEWFREQARKCQDQANQFEEMARQAEKVNMVLHWATTPGPLPTPQKTKTLTAEEFEKRIGQKSARVYMIAHEFNVTDAYVRSLLHPNSKVFEGGRGWLYLNKDA
jgi:hypothetical protein